MLYLSETAGDAIRELGPPGPDGIAMAEVTGEDGPLTILVVPAQTAEEDTDINFVSDVVVGVLGRLRAAIHAEVEPDILRAVLVVEEPTGGPVGGRAMRAALGEAARGISQGLAREIGPALRINTIRCQQANEKVLAATLGFLSSRAANFVTGSTIDLRSVS